MRELAILAVVALLGALWIRKGLAHYVELPVMVFVGRDPDNEGEDFFGAVGAALRRGDPCR